MKDILLIGINHETAPVELRECIAFSTDETIAALSTLREQPVIGEAMLVSTCNRIEVLMASDQPKTAGEIAKTFITGQKGVDPNQFEKSFYHHQGDEAVRHVFRVAASLDSMMIGEPQILGQVKDAYRTATVQKTSGVILNRLLHRAFSVAKRVRSETGIGDHAVSISYAAVQLAKKIFGDLQGKQAMLVGAGEMAELAVEHLLRNRVAAIFVANRTFARGVELARKFKGTAVRFEEIPALLGAVDIIISSTGASGYVVFKEQVRAVMRSRRNRPLFFIDIAVPRDIDPAINKLSNAYVYDIDDLKGVIEENIEDRNREAVRAERIIDEAVIRFRQWFDSLAVVPTIVALRKQVETIAQAELDKTLHNLGHLAPADHRAVEKLAGAITNKILHGPMQYLKSDGCHRNISMTLDIARKLFQLDE